MEGVQGVGWCGLVVGALTVRMESCKWWDGQKGTGRGLREAGRQPTRRRRRGGELLSI